MLEISKLHKLNWEGGWICLLRIDQSSDIVGERELISVDIAAASDGGAVVIHANLETNVQCPVNCVIYCCL